MIMTTSIPSSSIGQTPKTQDWIFKKTYPNKLISPRADTQPVKSTMMYTCSCDVECKKKEKVKSLKVKTESDSARSALPTLE